MDYLIPRIKEIAERISSAENRRRDLAKFLLSVKSGSSLACGVERKDPDGIRIAAVDGGIVKRSLHGFDFVLARGVGVVFDYSGGRVVKASYHPEKMPTPELSVMEALSDTDYLHSTSILRERIETRTARETVEKYKPDIMLMDGSVIPHYQDRPSRGSDVYRNYLEMIDAYKKLFDTCRKNNTILAGVVEDSRGVRFCNLVKKNILSKVDHSGIPGLVKVLDKTRDTNLLYWMLSEGERTEVFPYSDNPGDHPVLRDFGNMVDRVHSFYMKTARYDRPVRIDFLGEKDLAGKIGSEVLSISGHHTGYGIPSVLIEADQVAKLAEDDMENLYDRIISRTGSIPGIFRMRRDMRPF